ncbi:hypothetical protein OKW88_21220 [Bacillus subtilis]
MTQFQTGAEALGSLIGGNGGGSNKEKANSHDLVKSRLRFVLKDRLI